MRNRKTNRKGFTLVEILVALAIFALGGTAIMVLFITNVRLSRQAMDYTRASEISRNVRSLMTQSMARPINLSETDNVYAFYYPETAINFNADRYREQFEGGGATTTGRPGPGDLGGSAVEQTVFYRLPKQRFDAGAMNYFDPNLQLTVIPRDALNSDGSKATTTTGETPKAFGFLPDKLRRAGAIDGLDPDDRMFYQFDVSIRRSVQHSSVESSTGNGEKQALSDLYVVHVRIYKGYDYGENILNDPYFEWDFYINAAQ